MSAAIVTFSLLVLGSLLASLFTHAAGLERWYGFVAFLWAVSSIVLGVLGFLAHG